MKKDDSLGEPAFNVVGKVKNASEDTSTSFIHFKFLSSSGEVLANVQCNSGDLEPRPDAEPELHSRRDIWKVRQDHR